MKDAASIERDLLLLAAVTLSLFLLLAGALFVVQSSMGAGQERLERVIVPIQQDVAGLEGAIAAGFAREAEIFATESSAELDPVRDRTAIEQELGDARTQLKGHLAELGDANLRGRFDVVDKTVDDFLAGDKALFDSVARTHSLDARFRAALGVRNGELRDETVRVQDITGRAALASVLLLRRMAAGKGGVDEFVSGNVRAAGDAAQDLRGAIQRYAMLVALIGSSKNSDALNSMMANELPQARDRVVESLSQLSNSTADDADLAPRVQALRDAFSKTTQAVSDTADATSLVALRYATFAERGRAATIRVDSQATGKRLLEAARQVEAGAGDAAARARRSAQSIARAARFGSGFLIVLGLGVCAFAGRRIVHSVAALRATNAHLFDLKRELSRINEGLERTVDERTQELRRRERSLQLVLDATGDGLVSVGTDGHVLGEQSRAVGQWFGEARDSTVSQLLYPDDPRGAASFEMAWSQLVSDDLPFEVTLDQMPHALERGGRLYQLDYKPVREGEQLARMLVTIQDVTARRAAERSERDARALQGVVANVLKDPAGFRRGMGELAELVTIATQSRDPVIVRRALHTIKGGAGTFGFLQVAECAHALEEQLIDEDSQWLSRESAAALEESLRQATGAVEQLVGPAAFERVAFTRENLSELVTLLNGRKNHAEIAAWVDRLRQEPTSLPFENLAAQARRVAVRLGKEIDVQIDDKGVRVDPDRFGPVWTNLTHAVRNAVDHGIEDGDTRLSRGKPLEGHLVLRTEQTEDGAVLVEVSDDGGGIDFEGLREAARRRGLPSETREDLLEAFFADGISTREQATDVSGRGVGMAALREACLALGGVVQVATAAGKGTTLSLRIPPSSPKQETGWPPRRMTSIAPGEKLTAG